MNLLERVDRLLDFYADTDPYFSITDKNTGVTTEFNIPDMTEPLLKFRAYVLEQEPDNA